MFLSILVYPLSAVLSKNLQDQDFHIQMGNYAFWEFIKFLFLFTLEEMMELLIEEVEGDENEERFRSSSMVVESLI